MKIAGLFFTILTFFIGTGALAEPTESAPYLYVIFRGQVFDIDSFLEKDLSLKPLQCKYASNVNSQIYSFEGLGACVYKSFRDGNKTPDPIPGRIEAQFLEVKYEKKVTLELTWRFGRGGFWHDVGRVIKDYKRKPQTDEDGLLGTLSVHFPEASRSEESHIFSELGFLVPFLSQSPKGFDDVVIKTRSNKTDGRFTDVGFQFFGPQGALLYKAVMTANFFLTPPFGTVNGRVEAKP